MARGGVLYTAEGPRPFQLSDPRPPHEGDTAPGAAVLNVATAAADAADAAISISCLVSRHAVGYTPCTAAWAAALAAARTVPAP